MTHPNQSKPEPLVKQKTRVRDVVKFLLSRREKREKARQKPVPITLEEAEKALLGVLMSERGPVKLIQKVRELGNNQKNPVEAMLFFREVGKKLEREYAQTGKISRKKWSEFVE